jgi:hypothetical protein
MDKVFDDRHYEFPGLGKVAVCRLRVYREPGGKGPLVAVATEVADNPGASTSNAIEWLAQRVWLDFQPDSGHAPLLFDHWDTGSYRPPDRRGDEFSLVTFTMVRADKRTLAAPSWRWWPGSMVRRLVADPTLGDGYDRKLDPVDPGQDWTEQEAGG